MSLCVRLPKRFMSRSTRAPDLNEFCALVTKGVNRIKDLENEIARLRCERDAYKSRVADAEAEVRKVFIDDEERRIATSQYLAKQHSQEWSAQVAKAEADLFVQGAQAEAAVAKDDAAKVWHELLELQERTQQESQFQKEDIRRLNS
eukprot:gene18078-21533_t